MSFVRQWLLKNGWLKLFSLIIAFLLWAVYTGEPAAEVGFLVPVQYLSLAPNLEISGDAPTQVYLRVRGRPALLRRLTAHDFAIPLDLSDNRSGEKLFRISASDVDAPFGTEVVRVSPSTIRLQFIERPLNSSKP